MPTCQKVWKVNGAIIRQRGCSYQVETHHMSKRITCRNAPHVIKLSPQFSSQHNHSAAPAIASLSPRRRVNTFAFVV